MYGTSSLTLEPCHPLKVTRLDLTDML